MNPITQTYKYLVYCACGITVLSNEQYVICMGCRMSNEEIDKLYPKKKHTREIIYKQYDCTTCSNKVMRSSRGMYGYLCAECKRKKAAIRSNIYYYEVIKKRK